MINSKLGLGETVCAVLIPGDEADKFKDLENGELVLTHDGINFHLYSDNRHIMVMDNQKCLRFLNHCEKVKKNITRIKTQVIEIKDYGTIP